MCAPHGCHRWLDGRAGGGLGRAQHLAHAAGEPLVQLVVVVHDGGTLDQIDQISPARMDLNRTARVEGGSVGEGREEEGGEREGRAEVLSLTSATCIVLGIAARLKGAAVS